LWVTTLLHSALWVITSFWCCHLQEIAACKKTVGDLQKVVAEPAMGQSDLDVIKKKVRFFPPYNLQRHKNIFYQVV